MSKYYKKQDKCKLTPLREETCDSCLYWWWYSLSPTRDQIQPTLLQQQCLFWENARKATGGCMGKKNVGLPFPTSKKSASTVVQEKKKSSVIRKYRLYFPNSSPLSVTPEPLLCLRWRGLISERFPPQTQSKYPTRNIPVFKALRLNVFLLIISVLRRNLCDSCIFREREKMSWGSEHLRASQPAPMVRLGNPRAFPLLPPLPSFI